MSPIYITVGAQCVGKTTLLSRLKQRIISKNMDSGANPKSLIDITLDDQPGVWVPVNTQLFLDGRNRKKFKSFLNRRYIGKTIRRRIEEQAELSAILLHIAGHSTQQEFASSITQIYTNHTIRDSLRRNGGRNGGNANASGIESNNSVTGEMIIPQDYHTQIAQDLLEAVSDFRDSGQNSKLPDKVNLFCVEALFRPNPQTNETAIETATKTLYELANTSSNASLALAWGNTNKRPGDYKAVLEAAADSGRPVYFFVAPCNDTVVNNRVVSSFSSSSSSSRVFLPCPSFKELLRRNINRLLETGKYVPAKAIWDTSQMVRSLTVSVLKELDRDCFSEISEDGRNVGENGTLPTHSKLDFDKRLVARASAHFRMLDDRTIRFSRPAKPRKRRRR